MLKAIHKKLPLTFDLTDCIQMTIHEVKFYGEPNEWEEDSIGELLISDSISKKKEIYSIWFDDEGNHYVCLPTYEDSEDEDDDLDVFLVSDLIEEFSNIW